MHVLPVIVAKCEQKGATHTCQWGGDEQLETEAALVLFTEVVSYVAKQVRRQDVKAGW